MICPKCGLDNLEGIRRCTRCGALLITLADPNPPRARKQNRLQLWNYAWKRARGFQWPSPMHTPEQKEKEKENDTLLRFFSLLFFSIFLPSQYQFSKGRTKQAYFVLSLAATGLLGTILSFNSPQVYLFLLLFATAQTISFAYALLLENFCSFKQFFLSTFVFCLVCYYTEHYIVYQVNSMRFTEEQMIQKGFLHRVYLPRLY